MESRSFISYRHQVKDDKLYVYLEKVLVILSEMTWKILFILIPLSASFGYVHASTVVSEGISESADSLFSRTVYFPKSSSAIIPGFSHNKYSLDAIREFIDSLADYRVISIGIHGSASPEGNQLFNERLALKRAWILGQTVFNTSLCDSVDIRYTSGIAHKLAASRWSFGRSARIDIRYALGQDTSVNTIDTDDEKMLFSDNSSGSGITSDDVENNSGAESGSDTETPLSLPIEEYTGFDKRSLKMFVGTNLLYDAALVPNIGVGIHLGKGITLYTGWMHAWWNNKLRHRYWRVYGGDLELRTRLGHAPRASVSPFAGHHLGVYASMATYDFQFGNRTGVIGNKYNYAAGISYGYSLPVAHRLNFDFTAGVGYAWGKYKKHHPIDEHDVWLSTHKLKRFGPTRVEIGLQWLIGKGNHNARKGGRK